jgi:hypothetical protein
MFSKFSNFRYKPFYSILLLTFSFCYGSQIYAYLNESAEKPGAALKTIMVEVKRMNRQYLQYAEHIEGCKPAKFVLIDPNAFRGLVNSYFTKGSISSEEAEHIANEHEITYVILGLKGNKCRYTITKKKQPEKTWQCSISTKELKSLSNFFKAVSQNQTNVSIPSYPIATETCK